MRGDLILDELEVIGAATPLKDLPKRLNPIYRRRGSDTVCYFTVNGDVSPPELSLEEIGYFEEMVTSGDAVRFERAIPARFGHSLVQFENGVLPEYFPADDLPTRLVRACREALEQASRALAEGKRDEAEALAWYARRASTDDPLPLLMLISLLRGSVPSDEFAYLERDIEVYSRHQLENARRRSRERQELAAIGELLDEVPHSLSRPTYLAAYPSKPYFLTKARDLTGNVRRRAQG